MNWKKAKAEAKNHFSLPDKELPVTRISGFSNCEDCVYIAGFEVPVIVAVHNRTDLMRLRMMCDFALKHQDKEKI